MWKAFFTVLYFLCFAKVIDWIFGGWLSPTANVLALCCLFAAGIASFGLALFTVEKLKK